MRPFARRSVESKITPPPGWLLGWFSLAAALISLTISLYTFSTTQRRPKIEIVMSPFVRITQVTSERWAYLYVQPTFINSGISSRTEVVKDIRLVARKLPAGRPVVFTLGDEGKFVWDPDKHVNNWSYVADAGPMILPPNTARNPLLTFNGPDNWLFEAGLYALHVDAVGTAGAIRSDIRQLVITPDNVRFWVNTGGRSFVGFTTEPHPHRTPSSKDE